MDPEVARPDADVKRDEAAMRPARRSRGQAAIALLDIVAPAGSQPGTSGQRIPANDAMPEEGLEPPTRGL
jgi:hypothetical protein